MQSQIRIYYSVEGRTREFLRNRRITAHANQVTKVERVALNALRAS